MWLYRNILRPILFALPAEMAHEVGVTSLRLMLASDLIREIIGKRLTIDFSEHGFGSIERFGLKFKNPVGVAAGFDKNGKLIQQLSALGFGFIEIGTVTYKPQQGNEKPRLFRLPADKALINRLGFNNEGAEKIASRLKMLGNLPCVLGINIGKNRDVDEDKAIENYVMTFREINGFADYVTINVSSPNTPNLRTLQKADRLTALLKALKAENKNQVPLLVKIAPDLLDDEIEAIVHSCLSASLDGLVATNTTIQRMNLVTSSDIIRKIGKGGLSGKPLAKLSTNVIAKVYRLSKGKIPIIGVGGIFSAEDAFEKICAGASLLQVYTGFIYEGPGIAYKINSGLLKLLKQNGFSSLDQAVGSAIKL